MATMTVSDNWGQLPFTITVTDTTSGATNPLWSFGDGEIAGGTTATHTYTEAGTFTVTLQNSTGEATSQVVVTEPYTITIGSSTNVYPLSMVSDEQYASIVLRGMSNNWPTVMYDDGDYPLRKLSFWPVPTASNAVELWLWEPMLTYDNLDDELNLPPGYERYLKLKLAVEIAAEFGKEVPPLILKNMQEAEDNVKKLNQRIPVQQISSAARSLSKGNRQWTILDTYSGGDVGPWRP